MYTTDSVKLDKDGCVLKNVQVIRNKTKGVCPVWLTPKGQKFLALYEDHVFTESELFVFCRGEEMYGIPGVIKTGELYGIAGIGSLPRAPVMDIKPDDSFTGRSIRRGSFLEPMAEQGQTVVFNIKGKVSCKDDSSNPNLVRLICSMIIEELTPLPTDRYIQPKAFKALEEYMVKYDLPDGRLERTIDNIESCFRMATSIIPVRLLGSVYHSTEFQTLQFMTQGIFLDDDMEGVSYFDDKDDTPITQVPIKLLSDPDTIARNKERNRMLVEEGDTYHLDSIADMDEHRPKASDFL